MIIFSDIFLTFGYDEIDQVFYIETKDKEYTRMRLEKLDKNEDKIRFDITPQFMRQLCVYYQLTDLKDE